jgi:hypothetical protein
MGSWPGPNHLAGSINAVASGSDQDLILLPERDSLDQLMLLQHWSGAVMCPASHDGVSVKG